jgi:hypothetical protein
LFGLPHGRDEGKGGTADTAAAYEEDQGVVSFGGYTTNLTFGDNGDRCSSGYVHGWVQTCKQALTNPTAEKDVYGCPGVTDKQITNAQNAGQIRKSFKVPCMRITG